MAADSFDHNSASMGSSDHEDPTYNPFADEDDDPVTATPDRAFYSSALNPKHTSKPVVRRRKSTSGDSLSRHVSKKHGRSRTEIYVETGGSTTHPLRSAGVKSALQDVEITRPHLSRAIKTGTLVDAPIMDTDSVPVSPTKDVEKDVLVHEVTPKDSLAGVSLKYGIPLSELRRANHLWASDPIHLRKELYIPIDKAARAREYLPEPTLMSFTPDPSKESLDPFDALPAKEDNDYPAAGPSSLQPSPPKKATVIRVPTSQLSFFPPPSTANKTQSVNDGQPSGVQTYPATTATSGQNRYASLPASNSLTSFLTALPIAASTRDDIIQRLSLDSVSSSFSDNYRSDSEQVGGHELDDVTERIRRAPSLDNINRLDDSHDIHFQSLRTPKARFSQPSLQALDKSSNGGNKDGINPTSSRQGRSLLSTSPPLSYIPQSQHQLTVRTIQLEPSPSMILPAKTKTVLTPVIPLERTVSGSSSSIKSRGKRGHLNGDFDMELEHTQSLSRARTDISA